MEDALSGQQSLFGEEEDEEVEVAIKKVREKEKREEALKRQVLPMNEQAKRGYSREGRSDCKQVVVGLVINRDGFPKAHEVFDGNKV
ncbi:MAG: hypothetical protein AB1595_06905, partial [bacterium]